MKGTFGRENFAIGPGNWQTDLFRSIFPESGSSRNILVDLMNSIQRVVIRVDASVEMGMGHLTRCISLANALAEDGTRTLFLMRSHAAALSGLIESNGHVVQLLPDPARAHHDNRAAGSGHAHWLPVTWQRDAEETREAMRQAGAADWLVVDHYALDAQWEQMQRREGLRILAIDDLADRAHDCDILLDQNLVPDMEDRYRDRVQVSCEQLLGPRYALLRPEFAEQRRSLAARSGAVRRIVVCYGGSDPSNETAKTLAAIGCLASDSLSVDVVIGASNPHVEQVSRLCLELPRTRLHRSANNMAELIGGADLAIGAGGVMSWERCCLGVPTVAVDIAANQVGALTALARAGALLYLGSAASVSKEQMAASIGALLCDPARTRAMGEIALALVDGEGCGRVRASMRSVVAR